MGKGNSNIPKEAMRGIRPLIEQYIRADKDVDIARLVKKERQNILEKWTKEHPGYSISSRMQNQYKALVAQVNDIRPDLVNATQDLILECRKSMKLRAINETGAKALVCSMLEEAGYTDYSIESQRYRIKVRVIVNSRVVVIPLKFSEMPAAAEKIIPGLEAASKLCNDFGRDFKIL